MHRQCSSVSGDIAPTYRPSLSQERMIRRSRISVRPNVGRPGRAGATATPQEAPTPQDEPPAHPTPAESTAQTEDNNTTAAVEGEDNSSPTTAASTTVIQRWAAIVLFWFFFKAGLGNLF